MHVVTSAKVTDPAQLVKRPRGDAVVICHEVELPDLIYALQKLRDHEEARQDL